MPRLLACHACRTLIRLDDYSGAPEYDGELQAVVDRHQHKEMGYGVNGAPKAKGQLMGLDQATYDRIGQEVEVDRLKLEGQAAFYSLRDEFKEEAAKCFAKHFRPSDGCSDYESDDKRLGNRSLNVPPENRRYLCHHCPVHSFVITEVRRRRGMYA